MGKKPDHPFRLHRQLRGIGQSELARNIGKSRPTITAIEEGRNRMPSTATLTAAARQFGVPLEQLRAEMMAWLAKQDDIVLTPRARAVLQLPPESLTYYRSFTDWRAEITDTVNAFGSLLRVNTGVIAQYERGDRVNGMSDRLSGALQTVLGVSPEYLAALQKLPTG